MTKHNQFTLAFTQDEFNALVGTTTTLTERQRRAAKRVFKANTQGDFDRLAMKADVACHIANLCQRHPTVRYLKLTVIGRDASGAQRTMADAIRPNVVSYCRSSSYLTTTMREQHCRVAGASLDPVVLDAAERAMLGLEGRA